MKKRLTAAILTGTLLLPASGCAPLFKKEYLSITEYQDMERDEASSEFRSISTYQELKSAVISLVNKHQTEGRLRFINYSGALQTDINQARLEVLGENALASFSVASMSYDLSPVVTYYEAVLHITYKRSQSEIADILYITGRTELREIIDSMLEELESRRTLRIISSTIQVEEVEAAVNESYEKNPVASVLLPIARVEVHPEKGLHRIIEIELEYGWKLTELQKMKSELHEKLGLLTKDNEAAPAQRALTIYERLIRICSYDPTGAQRARRSELDSGLGATPYGALVEGLADSRGMAAAYSALCNSAGLESRIVNGSLHGEPHSWNLVQIRGLYYHVDASAYTSLGTVRSFLRSDDAMTEHGYEWESEDYPQAQESLDYHELS